MTGCADDGRDLSDALALVTPRELNHLLNTARALPPMTPEQVRAQAESFVIAEAGFGSDADEAAYRVALENNDLETLTTLDLESQTRMRRARQGATHMSTTTTPTPNNAPPATNRAVAVATDGAKLIATLETADPALYAQLVGTLATYSKSAAAPLIGSLLGALVAHYGLGPYVTPDTLTLLTEALVGIGTAGGALIMHWWAKGPGRALLPTAPGG